MTFKAGKVKVGDKEVSDSKLISVDLEPKEIELLLLTIKNSLFKGEYVELLYNLTLKLQNEYIKNKK